MLVLAAHTHTHTKNGHDKRLENEKQRVQANGRTVLCKTCKGNNKMVTKVASLRASGAKQSLPVFKGRKRSTAKGRDNAERKHAT